MNTKTGEKTTACLSGLHPVLFLFLQCIFLWQPAVAQTFLFDSQTGGKQQYSLRYIRPYFAGDVDISALSGIYDLAIGVPASRGVSVVSSVPFVVAHYRHNTEKSGIGNVYLGIQRCRREGTDASSMESIGLHLPTAGTNAINWFGYLANFQQQHKYLPKTLTVTGTYGYKRTWQKGGLFGFQIGPDLWIPTEGERRDAEILLHYGLNGGFQTGRLTVMLELVGLALVTGDWDEPGDLLKHGMVLGAQWNAGSFHPAVFCQLYLENDLRDSVDGVLGLKLEYVPE